MRRGQTGRLAILSDAIYPYHKGGKEERIRALSQALVAQGVDVHIYTMKWWEGSQTVHQDGVTLHAIMPRLKLYTPGGRRSIWQAVVFSLATLKLVTESFDTLEVDHMPIIPMYAARVVTWVRRKPLVATFHEVWGLKTWKDYLGPLAYIAAAIEWLSARIPDRIIAVSDQTARSLKSELNCRKPITIVPNGIHTQALQAVIAAPTPSDIVFVGRLIKHKNVKLLLEALALMRDQRPAVSALIIGDGPERDALQANARQLTLSNVTFAGRVESDEEKFQLMKASKVFVSPSEREGFGITLLEANACGLSVVTADVPGNAGRHLITGDNGRRSQLSAEALAEAITSELGRPDDQRRSASQTAAAAYDWSVAAQKLQQVYGL